MNGGNPLEMEILMGTAINGLFSRKPCLISEFVVFFKNLFHDFGSSGLLGLMLGARLHWYIQTLSEYFRYAAVRGLCCVLVQSNEAMAIVQPEASSAISALLLYIPHGRTSC